MLRILNNAFVHFSLLRCFLKHYHVANSSLADGEIAQLINLIIKESDETEFDNVYYAINDSEEDPIKIPNLDTLLYFQSSDAIYEFKKALSDQAVNACCSCETYKKKVCH
uniref:Uncharacterized protein n=1 Tax=Amphimedon queenslandica TaxID=400682 RepID=A0A1X7STS8_AMPQE